MRATLVILTLLAAVSCTHVAAANVTDVVGDGCGHHMPGPVDTMCPYEDCHNPMNCHRDTCIVWALDWCYVSF